MKIALASDHAGFSLRETVINKIKDLGHEVIDFGTFECSSVDFSDFAVKGAQAVVSKQAEKGVFICGSGVGMCISANKVKGTRASVAHDTYSAAQGVEHEDMNILCLGARVIGPSIAEEIVEKFLNAKFQGLERQVRRLNKIIDIENNNFK
ncbi:Ribose-5-phosphate isomerase [Elusimicrobium minutum Pei191]|uniref:Ribose-5-phosphate isomerase n=1 Tax=Elusimicrobium minutum (strain Pei191) TaxID=445932 RepID=B2KDS3_ELUMP|nr:ribose 5-phosphate isomerase B [Elusimicrobium minutum]ACC98669.1 Ribose-5-phosphate isomerase [Elusimicrobium minutum Pei191]